MLPATALNTKFSLDPSTDDPMQLLVDSASKLYSLPDVFFRVREIINDPESEIQELSDALSTDPGLSARLLKVANSAFFGLMCKIETITRAIQIVGFQHIYDLVIATSITKTFQGMSNGVMSMDAFWMKSVERALLARKLAEYLGVSDCERMFVGGLLLDVGHLVMYELKPEESQQALQISEEQQKPLCIAEQEVLGFSAADLGSALTRNWNFPEQFSDLIFYQDLPELAKENRLETAIVHTAKQLTGAIPNSDSMPLSFASISAIAKEELNLTLEYCQQVVEEALIGVSETLDLILPHA